MTGDASITLRDVRLSDLSGIVEVDHVRSGGRKTAYWTGILERYGGEDHHEERVALVAADARGVVHGFLFGEIRAWEFGSERCGWIFSVAVRPARERGGLATRLCDEAVRRFAAQGVGLVRTMVRRDDVPMLALFRSMGYAAGPFTELERQFEVATVAATTQAEGAA